MLEKLLRAGLRDAARARCQIEAVFYLACGMLRGKPITKHDLANAKRSLEIDLRDSGFSRGDATRIAGATLRRFKPNT